MGRGACLVHRRQPGSATTRNSSKARCSPCATATTSPTRSSSAAASRTRSPELTKEYIEIVASVLTSQKPVITLSADDFTTFQKGRDGRAVGARRSGNRLVLHRRGRSGACRHLVRPVGAVAGDRGRHHRPGGHRRPAQALRHAVQPQGQVHCPTTRIWASSTSTAPRPHRYSSRSPARSESRHTIECGKGPTLLALFTCP